LVIFGNVDLLLGNLRLFWLYFTALSLQLRWRLRWWTVCVYGCRF